MNNLYQLGHNYSSITQNNSLPYFKSAHKMLQHHLKSRLLGSAY